jgi:hypothetical protein
LSHQCVINKRSAECCDFERPVCNICCLVLVVVGVGECLFVVVLTVHTHALPLLLFVFDSRNKQGQTRFSSYYEWISMDERTALESEIIRKCLSRSEHQCSFLEYRGYKVIYRRYASLFFIVGTKPDLGEAGETQEGAENTENELGMLEFIHTVVEVSRSFTGESFCFAL